MKFLIVTGSNEVVLASNEQEAQRARQSESFDKVVDLAHEKEQVKDNVVAFPSRVAAVGGSSQNFDLNAQLDALEEKLVREAMEATGQNQVKAARLLGITRGALQYKLKRIASKFEQAA